MLYVLLIFLVSGFLDLPVLNLLDFPFDAVNVETGSW